MPAPLSEEVRRKVREMHQRGIPHSAIAQACGCSKGHVGKIVNPEAEQRYRLNEAMRSLRPWMPSEIAQAVSLRNRGVTYSEIGRRLGRTTRSVESQLSFRRDDGSRIKPHKVGAQPQIPDYVLADRDRRMAMRHTDLTAKIFGDPLR